MSSLFAKRFYEGGFEDKMTRREAALILGVRYVLGTGCTLKAKPHSTGSVCDLTGRARPPSG
jgi:hypothetical protein